MDVTSSPPKLHIRSAADLVAAIREPNPLVRLGVLRHVARHPEKALAYGTHEGRDALDAIIEETRGIPPGQMRQVAVLAICNFRDPRAIDFLMRDLPTNVDTPSVVSITIRLGEEATEPVRRLLVDMLDRDAFSAHARTAANVLAWWPGWEPDAAQRLRMALLSDVGQPEPPPFDAESAHLWLEQLRGPVASRAWEFLELQGRAAFVGVGMRWDDLDDEQRLALLQWGGRRHLEDVRGLLRPTLASPSVDLVLEALRLLALLPSAQDAHQERLRELWRHDRLDVRRAVIRAGLRGLDWRAEIAATPDMALRRDLMVAYARHCPEAALPHVLECFAAPEWQIRAMAVQLAVAAGEAAIEGARPYAFHELPEVRLAACQALIGLGQQEWLEETFL